MGWSPFSLYSPFRLFLSRDLLPLETIEPLIEIVGSKTSS